ncbi:MAG: serpin family protein [Polyangiaceae bacterium]|nr:serpin family protein [Polyangiaceae bacterium]
MKTLSILPLVLSLSTLACTTTVEPNPAAPVDAECHDATKAGCVIRSSQQRIQTPDVPSADLAALVQGNTDFAADLYQRLRTEPGNFFYSPHSISSALGMTWAGARTQTEKDMASALHFTLPQAQFHPAMNALDLELASRGEGAQGADGGVFRLNIANALWGQVGYHFESDFLDVLGLNYGAGMHIVDFETQSLQAVDLINGWVEKKTENRIKDILSPDSVDSSTRLVLTNAVYFNAAWQTPFEPAQTKPGTFTTQAGTMVTVPMMHGSLEVPYGAGADYVAVELPYDGGELSMVLVLPNDLAAFEASLTGAKMDQIVGSLSHHMVDTTMPTFEFESKFGLVDPLKDMGMGIAFSDGADFSGINGKGGLVITDVIHQSFVKVNEAGTEAAAATAVIVGETSVPEPATISLDKPFVFFIRDFKTKAVLFVGRVADPS